MVSRPRSISSRGFTLVELLVVIGIIVVLVGILLPAIAGARKRAQTTQCMSNIRQIVMAYVIYTNDNGGRGVQFSTTWVDALREQARLPAKLYFCPMAAEPGGDEFGSAQKAWTYTRNLSGGPVPASGGYGFNGWLMRWEGVGKGSQPYSGGSAEQYVSGNTPRAVQLPVIADATWLDAWPRTNDPAPPDLQGGDRQRQGWQQAPNENMMARFTIARHGSAINIGYLDGHVSTIPLPDLKRQMWHNGWIEQAWSPALPAK